MFLGENTRDRLDPKLRLVEDRRQDRSAFRNSMENSWYLSMLYYMGFQWSYASNGTINMIPESVEKVRFRGNLIQSNVDHSVSKLTHSPPDWNVDTENASYRVGNAANVAERYIEHIYDINRMSSKIKVVFRAARVYGTTFLKVWWDHQSGNVIDVAGAFNDLSQSEHPDVLEATKHMMFNGDTERADRVLSGHEKLFEGEVRIEHITPFCVEIDDLQGSVDDAQWAVISKLCNKTQIERRFNVLLDHEPISLSRGVGMVYRIQNLTSPNLLQQSAADQKQLEDAVVLRELWERPSLDYPRGRLIIYAGSKMLFEGENPYEGLKCEIPLVAFRDATVPDRLWGQSATEQAIPAQRAANKSKSDILQALSDGAQNKWFVPRQAALLGGALDRSTDEAVEYNAPFAPSRVAGAGVPQGLFENFNHSSSLIDELFGVNEVSKGQMPTGVTSGVQVQLLQEADENRLGSILQDGYDGLERVGMMILDLSKRFITEPRQLRDLLGEEAEGEIIDFIGEDLNYRKVSINMGSMLHRSRAGEKESWITVLQYGGIDPSKPAEKQMLFDGMSMSKHYQDPTRSDRLRAMAENKMLAKGQQVAPRDFEDTDIHLIEHNKYRKSPEYYNLQPEIQQNVDMHCQLHQMMQAQMAQQMMQGMMPQGQAPMQGGQPPQTMGMLGGNVPGGDLVGSELKGTGLEVPQQ